MYQNDKFERLFNRNSPFALPSINLFNNLKSATIILSS